MTPGDVLGHEPMGIVEAVGSGVANLQVGDRVVVPFNIACGHCFMCEHGLQSQCETTQVREHGMRCGVVRLHQAVRAGARRTGRTAAGAACRLRTDQGAARAARRSFPVPVRRPADRVAGSRVRRGPERWQRSSCWASARSATWPAGSPSTGDRATSSASTWFPSGWSAPVPAASRRSTSTTSTTQSDLVDAVRRTNGRGPTPSSMRSAWKRTDPPRPRRRTR